MAKEAELIISSQPFFRFDLNKTRAQANLEDEGVKTIFRDGLAIIVYEGAEIEFNDLSDKQAGHGHEPPLAGVLPGQLELLDRINSRINPSSLSHIDSISSRVVAPINRIRLLQRVSR